MESIKVHVVDRGRKFLYLRYIDPVTGKGVEKSSRASNRKDAAKAAGKWESELREGRYKPASRVTWQEFTRRYEDEHVAALADGTAIKVAATFAAIEEIINPARLADMTANTISAFQQSLRDRGLTESTIAGHLRHLKAALNWARDVGLLHTVPTIRMPQRARTSKMKGRPITGEEFDRMLAAVPKAVLARERRETGEADWKDHERERIASWRFLLRGLWFSGLRLGEALDLHWQREDRLSIDLSGKRPMLRIAAEAEKGHKDRLLPLAPEAAELLLTIPEADRTGRVFNPLARSRRGERLALEAVSRVITDIGKAATVKVASTFKGDVERVKWASAHDLRRAFGSRWANRVMPAVLQQLMRHESIETTLAFYVGRDAQATAEILYGSLDSDTSGDTAQSEPIDAGENACKTR